MPASPLVPSTRTHERSLASKSKKLLTIFFLTVIFVFLRGQAMATLAEHAWQEPQNELPQRLDPLPDSLSDGAMQQLLEEIEGGLRSIGGAFQASGYARLARLYSRSDPDRAERLWTDALYSSLDLERKSTLLTTVAGKPETRADTGHGQRYGKCCVGQYDSIDHARRYSAIEATGALSTEG